MQCLVMSSVNLNCNGNVHVLSFDGDGVCFCNVTLHFVVSWHVIFPQPCAVRLVRAWCGVVWCGLGGGPVASVCVPSLPSAGIAGSLSNWPLRLHPAKVRMGTCAELVTTSEGTVKPPLRFKFEAPHVRIGHKRLSND